MAASYFTEQVTLEEFKVMNNTEKIKLVRNPHTGKGFMTNSSGSKVLGAISSKISSQAQLTNPMLGLTSTGVWVLYNQSESVNSFGTL